MSSSKLTYGEGVVGTGSKSFSLDQQIQPPKAGPGSSEALPIAQSTSTKEPTPIRFDTLLHLQQSGQQGNIAKDQTRVDDAVIRGLQSLNVDLPNEAFEKVASSFEGKLPMDRFHGESLGRHNSEVSSATAARDVETTTSCQGRNGSAVQQVA